MATILASLLRYYYIEEDGSKRPVPLVNANCILDNIIKYIPHKNKLVIVANDPTADEDNDECSAMLARSFALAGLNFDKTIVLDGRNGDRAKEICGGASIIYLRGGKCVGQLEFLRSIGMDEILRATDALVIGVSAGAMALGKTVANFPEDPVDLPDSRWLSGLGVTDITVIPHFDGGALAYQFPCEHFDTAKDYILPMSIGKEFIGIANDGYILIDKDEISLFGDVCTIKDGVVSKK